MVPINPFRNFIIIISILFNLFEIPIALFLTKQVYYSEINTALGLILNITFLILLYIDTFLVRTNISYYHNGKLINKYKNILQKYFHFEFWINILSLLSLTIYISAGNPNLIYIKLFFFAKIYSLNLIDQQIMRVLKFKRITYVFYRLCKMVIFLWFFTTLAASIFFAIDYSFYIQKGTYYQNNQLWLTNTYAVSNLNLIENYTWFVWYSYALYWALQTASTVGYGDLTPMNPPQVLYVVIALLIITIVWVFYVNTIWTILAELSNGIIQSSQKWKKVIQYFKSLSINIQAKQKIMNYLYQFWQETQNIYIENIIKNQVSKQLRDQLQKQHLSPFFFSIDAFIILNCDTMTMNDALTDLVYQIQFQCIPQGKHAYSQGQSNEYLYYIEKGQIQLSIKGSQLKSNISSGNFGIQQFFKQQNCTHNAIAKTYCKIWKLSFTNFKKTLKNKYKHLHQSLCQLYSQINLQNSPNYLNLKCWKCQSYQHFLNQCPQIISWMDSLMYNRNNIHQKYQGRKLKKIRTQRVPIIKRHPIKSNKILGKHRKTTIGKIDNIQNVYFFSYYMPKFNIKNI